MSTKAAENNNLVPAQPKTKDEGTPENNAKIHVHDAMEKTEDIKPKQVGPENAKEILTGALAQKVSEFNVRFKKKAATGDFPPVTERKPMSPNAIHMGQFAADTGLLGAAFGGVAGGVGGGLAGLISPGTYEENGVKKRRSRLMGGLTGVGNGAMAGVVGGGAIGGLGGAGLLQLARNMENAKAAKTAGMEEMMDKATPHFTDTQLMLAPLLSAGVGGLGGALLSNKKNRLRNALLGAAGGGLVGGGASLGYKLMHTPSQSLLAEQKQLEKDNAPLLAAMQAMDTAAGTANNIENNIPSFLRPKSNPADAAARQATVDEMRANTEKLRAMPKTLTNNVSHMTGMLGGAGGAALGGAGAAGLIMANNNADKKKKRTQQGGKSAALTDYGSIGGGAMVGGLGGAALGGLAGLISPGQETEYDNYGRPVGSKQRSRLGAALRGALGGGAIGGLGGAAAGHFMGPQTNQALAALQPYLNSAQEYGKGMYSKMFPQKDNIAVPAGSIAKRDQAGAPITVEPKATPAASSPTANPKAGIDLPPPPRPTKGPLADFINGAMQNNTAAKPPANDQWEEMRPRFEGSMF